MAAQVFAGQVVEFDVRVDQPHTIRSVHFEKVEPGTRLRVTYRDKAVTAFSRSPFTTTVQLKLDGVELPLLRTVFDTAASRIGQFDVFRVTAPFTTVGWVSDVPAGTHTLDSCYLLEGPDRPVVGYVSGSPYLVEIDEVT